MSKAFTRESDDELPEEPVVASALATLPPGAKNYLTERGARRLREELSRLIQVDRPRLSSDGNLLRELRAVDARIKELEDNLFSAEIVPSPEERPERVTFGATVLATKTITAQGTASAGSSSSRSRTCSPGCRITSCGCPSSAMRRATSWP